MSPQDPENGNGEDDEAEQESPDISEMAARWRENAPDEPSEDLDVEDYHPPLGEDTVSYHGAGKLYLPLELQKGIGTADWPVPSHLPAEYRHEEDVLLIAVGKSDVRPASDGEPRTDGGERTEGSRFSSGLRSDGGIRMETPTMQDVSDLLTRIEDLEARIEDLEEREGILDGPEEYGDPRPEFVDDIGPFEEVDPHTLRVLADVIEETAAVEGAPDSPERADDRGQERATIEERVQDDYQVQKQDNWRNYDHSRDRENGRGTGR